MRNLNSAKMNSYEEAVKCIKHTYGGLNWPALFARIRFFTAPYRQLVSFVPVQGLTIDLGCGYGIFSNLLGLLSPERKILGLDLDAYKIRYANRGFANVECRPGDITKLDLPPADAILLVHVLHHLNSYQEQEVLLQACFKKLKNGSKLIIAEIDSHPTIKFLLARIADFVLYPGDKIYYRQPNDLRALLEQLDFKVEIKRWHAGTPFSHIGYICTKTTDSI